MKFKPLVMIPLPISIMIAGSVLIIVNIPFGILSIVLGEIMAMAICYFYYKSEVMK